jgi:hypothetical protein
MRPRTVFVGCLAGLAAGLLLYPVFSLFWPGLVLPEFSRPELFPPFIPIFCLFSALDILAAGYLAARLEWARTRGAAVSVGLQAGLLAGCLAYLGSGAAAAAGVLGHKEILASLAAPVSSESVGTGYLLLAVVNTVVWMQVLFWVILLPSLGLGALGGLLARLEKSPGWFSEPLPKAPGLERFFVYTLSLYLTFLLVIVESVFEILAGLVSQTQLAKNAPMPGLLLTPAWMHFLPLVSGGVFLVISLILIAGWVQEAWEIPAERFKLQVWLGGVIFLGLLLWFLSRDFGLVLGLVFLLILLTVRLVRKINPPRPSETPVWQPYTWADFAASGLTQGVLCAALTMGLLMGYALFLTQIAAMDVSALTLTGPVKISAAEQIKSVYNLLFSSSLIFLLIGSLAGLGAAKIGAVTVMAPAYPVRTVEVIDLMKFIETEALKEKKE